MGLPPAALFDWRRHNCRHPRWQRRKTENRNEEPLLCLAAIHLQLLLQSLLSPSACSCQKAAPNLRSERRAVECRNWHGLYPMSDYRYFLGYHRSAIRCPAPLRRCTKRGTITLEKTVSRPRKQSIVGGIRIIIGQADRCPKQRIRFPAQQRGRSSWICV